jgi:hypothetical protein
MDSALRARIRNRAKNRCEYCALPQEHAPFPLFHIEHIRPKKHGGSDAEDNLCLACNYCNLHKSSNLTGIDPQTGSITPLYHPRKDRWDEHFAFDGASVVGRTAIGRATVRVLNMNDPERVELRLVWRRGGSEQSVQTDLKKVRPWKKVRPAWKGGQTHAGPRSESHLSLRQFQIFLRRLLRFSLMKP